MSAAPTVTLHTYSAEVEVPVDKGTVYTVADALHGRGPRTKRTILDSVCGQVKPGTMTLVLGAPGCGKTTFLKSVADQLPPNVQQSGALRYDDKTPDSFDSSRVLSYVEQRDDNLPTLTVKETLELSHRFQGGSGPSPATIIEKLGLTNCQDTIVGNFMLRGISGGEKRRATLGEMLVGPQVGWCLDEVTTGLDSATAAAIFRYLRGVVDEKQQWVVAALLQPPPDVYELFDEIVVLSEGAIAYWGPAAELPSYLSDIGYPIPANTEVPDWVQDVVSGTLEAAHNNDAESGHAGVPVAELPAHFAHSRKGKPKAESPTSSGAWATSPAPALSYLTILRLLIWRQWLVLFRNRPLFFGRIGQSVGNAVFVGSVFYNIGFDEYQSAFGTFFFVLMCGAMNSMIMVPLIVLDRPVYQKQSRAKFFPASAYLIGDMISQIPLTLLETIGFVSVVYFLAGFTTSDDYEHFWMANLVGFCFSMAMAEWFKITGSIAPDAASALPFCGLTTVCFVLQSGFVATKDNIPDAWIWVYHISPLSWGIRGLAVNEFDSSEYSDATLTLADGSTETAGQVYLGAYGFDGLEYDFIWTCIGVLLAEIVAFLTIHWIAKRTVRWDGSGDGTTAGKITAGSSDATDKPPTDVELQVKNAQDGKQGATFVFRDISYTVKVKKQKEGKQLLHSISGYCMPGRVTALMGASGAGKTTLLDVLAGRKTHGKMEGEILINGHAKDPAVFSQVTAYVEQQDVHTKMATVEEAVQFSAALRLPASLTEAERKAAVESTLQKLELDTIRDRIVGSLSGAQLKRVTIAVELVTDPLVMFLDEPTSGLDSRAAALVMKSIRKIADLGKTVILTVHQPSALIVESFDDLLLLQRGGYTVYSGPFQGIVPYLENVDGVEPMPEGTNPADFMLDTIHDMSDKMDFTNVYQGSGVRSAANEAITAASQPADKLTVEEMPATSVGFSELLKRTRRTFWRTPTYTLARFAAFMAFALTFGTTYAGGDDDKVDTLLSRATMLLMISIFCGWMCQVMCLPGAAVERSVFYREKPNNSYNPSAYVLASQLMEIPYVVFTTTCFSLVLYPFVFEWDGERFAWFLLFFTQSIYLCVVFGYFLVAVMPNELLAQLGCVGGITMWALFGGVMQPADTMGAWKIVYWISPFHYAVEGMITTQWHGDTSPVETLLGGTTTADQLVSEELYTDFDYDNRWRNVAILAGITALFMVQTHWATHKINHQKR